MKNTKNKQKCTINCTRTVETYHIWGLAVIQIFQQNRTKTTQKLHKNSTKNRHIGGLVVFQISRIHNFAN